MYSSILDKTTQAENDRQTLRCNILTVSLSSVSVLSCRSPPNTTAPVNFASSLPHSFCLSPTMSGAMAWSSRKSFVAVVKAHAKLRCCTYQTQSGDVKEFDEEMYAKMTYWVCAYAPKIRSA